MRHPIFALAILCGLLSTPKHGSTEVSTWRMGGPNGHDWGDWARVNTMMDVEASPGSIQPFELHPEENLLGRLGPWARWRKPRNPLWRAGEPRIWRWLGTVGGATDWEPRLLLDGDPFTGFAAKSYRASYVSREYYTLDLGAPAPVERFRTIPKEGVDELSGEPYRPGFAQRNFAVSGGDESELSSVDNETAYAPLPVLLAYVENNVHFEAQVRFPLQYLRLIRYRAFHDLGEDVFADMARQEPPKQARYGLGELELYGRGFVPKATWESRVIDLGEMSNFGQVHFGLSRWRREEDDYVPDGEAKVDARIELKSGLDDTPTTYYTYDAMGKLVEASEETYVNKLQTRQHPWHPAGIGWRGPIVEDTDNWSFWTAPLGESGGSPRLPRGRYFKVRVQLLTDGLWEFARMESLVVVSSPLLAERILGEVAVAGQLQPVGNLAQVSAGDPTELIYEIRAEFSGPVQSGFDAVRMRTPGGDAQFLGLEMGDPLAVALPDSVVDEATGLVVYLPRRIDSTGDGRLRLRLRTTLYNAAADLPADAFERSCDSLPQGVEAGNASDDVGTDQLRVLALPASLGGVLGPVRAQPRAFTPQGDGVNDRVELTYTLFTVRSALVEVSVYTVDGIPVRRLYSGRQGAGPQLQVWDGRDDGGELVAPGIYLLKVDVQADRDRFSRLNPVALVY